MSIWQMFLDIWQMFSSTVKKVNPALTIFFVNDKILTFKQK